MTIVCIIEHLPSFEEIQYELHEPKYLMHECERKILC